MIRLHSRRSDRANRKEMLLLTLFVWCLIACKPHDVMEPVGAQAAAQYLGWHRQGSVVVGFLFDEDQRCRNFIDDPEVSMQWPRMCLEFQQGQGSSVYRWQIGSNQWFFLNESQCDQYRREYCEQNEIGPCPSCQGAELPQTSLPKRRRVVFNDATREWYIANYKNVGPDEELMSIRATDYLVLWELGADIEVALALFDVVGIAENSIEISPVCWNKEVRPERVAGLTRNPGALRAIPVVAGFGDGRVGYCWAKVKSHQYDSKHRRIWLDVAAGEVEGVEPGHVFTLRGPPVASDALTQVVIDTLDDVACHVPGDEKYVQRRESKCYVEIQRGVDPNPYFQSHIVILEGVRQ